MTRFLGPRRWPIAKACRAIVCCGLLQSAHRLQVIEGAQILGPAGSGLHCDQVLDLCHQYRPLAELEPAGALPKSLITWHAVDLAQQVEVAVLRRECEVLSRSQGADVRLRSEEH